MTSMGMPRMSCALRPSGPVRADSRRSKLISGVNRSSLKTVESACGTGARYLCDRSGLMGVSNRGTLLNVRLQQSCAEALVRAGDNGVTSGMRYCTSTRSGDDQRLPP